jgi:hypothetical protein
MARQTKQATDDLTIEAWSSGDAASQPLIRIRCKAMKQGNEPGVAVVYLGKVRRLIDALAEAATNLVAADDLPILSYRT